jgi:deoxyribonuclease V
MQIPSASRCQQRVTPAEAMQIQRELAPCVSEQDMPGEVRLIAGVDVGFEGANNQTARAAVVVLQFPELIPIDSAIARLPVTFPYVPGLLAFREIPIVLNALRNLKTDPDILIVDGQGKAHPRRLGIASHLGVLLDCPTIGCAKSILCGTAQAPANRVGAWTPLLDRDEQIGAAVRTRAGTTPIYVSVGHRVSLARAIDLVLRCCKGYRLPETTRLAHRVAGGETLKRGSIPQASDA